MSNYQLFIDQMDKSYHDTTYDEKRSKLHQLIIESHFINKHKTDKKQLILMAGAYGSGKSFILKKLFMNKTLNDQSFIHIDVDIIRTKLPEYESLDKYTLSLKTDKEAKFIAEIIQRKCLSEGHNLVINGSKHNTWWSDVFIPWLRNVHPEYEITVIYVKTDWNTLLKRIKSREDRFISIETLKESYDNMAESIKNLSELVDKVIEINNNEEIFFMT
jgi:predicted ABC-type ATPase